MQGAMDWVFHVLFEKVEVPLYTWMSQGSFRRCHSHAVNSSSHPGWSA